MSLHDELLASAQRLVSGVVPTEADIRRAISAAYYALFHRLIDAAVVHFLPAHSGDQRAGFARTFEHARMREICQRVVKLPAQPNPTPAVGSARVLGPVIPAELRRVAEAFDLLQKHRFEADYDRVPPTNRITLASAQGSITQVASAFTDWSQLETANSAVAQAFLVLLLTGEPKSR